LNEIVERGENWDSTKEVLSFPIECNRENVETFLSKKKRKEKKKMKKKVKVKI